MNFRASRQSRRHEQRLFLRCVVVGSSVFLLSDLGGFNRSSQHL
jgi:hypothetical protein